MTYDIMCDAVGRGGWDGGDEWGDYRFFCPGCGAQFMERNAAKLTIGKHEELFCSAECAEKYGHKAIHEM